MLNQMCLERRLSGWKLAFPIYTRSYYEIGQVGESLRKSRVFTQNDLRIGLGAGLHNL